ncbi:hypothetical protein [Enterococcus gallinarum]|uniref:hypothetical protein n=1 Tax=Enterococcus gallinarum TaxID=1353 RepID=UPI0009858774|nr:hypothetical protein [Enterococcus gallinarum]MCR1930915.1 hypothetical protein [Enterococcus gallinarum]OOG28436.1 hypothetical protein BZK37_01475 [Enterococcus casseliflavus]
MHIFGLTVTEFLAVLSFFAGGIFGLMKYYDLFMDLKRAVKELNKTIASLEQRFDNHEIRLTRLEEQNKTIFKSIGGRKHEKD